LSVRHTLSNPLAMRCQEWRFGGSPFFEVLKGCPMSPVKSLLVDGERIAAVAAILPYSTFSDADENFHYPLPLKYIGHERV